MGFVALRIISGIFMTETLRLCSSNDLIMALSGPKQTRDPTDAEAPAARGPTPRGWVLVYTSVGMLPSSK